MSNISKRGLDPRVVKIDIIYTVIQSCYWSAYCTIGAFAAVYLSSRGLNNTQIGFTTSLGCFLAIFLQLFVSNYSDKHPERPIKRTISELMVLAIAAITVVGFMPVPISMMIVAFAVATSANQSNNGYLNAQMMQLNNAGIPAHYGAPRGIGSLCYAFAAYGYGILTERYSPAVLMPIFIGFTVICIIFLMFMPDPYKGVDRTKFYGGKDEVKHTSYKEMLLTNPTLMVLLACVVINSIGQTAAYTFIIRVVESVGGGTKEFGISELIRAGVEMPVLCASGFLLAHFKPKTLVATAFLMNGIRIGLMAVAVNIGFVYASSITNLFVSGVYVAGSVVFANSIVRVTERIRSQSLVILCGSIGSIIGNAYAGFMIDRVGLHIMLGMSTVSCVLAGILLVLFCKPKENV